MAVIVPNCREEISIDQKLLIWVSSAHKDGRDYVILTNFYLKGIFISPCASHFQAEILQLAKYKNNNFIPPLKRLIALRVKVF